LIVEEEELDLMVATKSVPPPDRVSSPLCDPWAGRQAGRQAAPILLLSISILKRQLLHHKEVELRNSCYENANSPPKKNPKKKPKKTTERERQREEKCATSNASPESKEPNQSYTNHTTKKQTKNFLKCQKGLPCKSIIFCSGTLHTMFWMKITMAQNNMFWMKIALHRTCTFWMKITLHNKTTCFG
jgi:hypothetical protein